MLPQNWLFLASYRKLREKLLKTETWHLLARLGAGELSTRSVVAGRHLSVLLTLSHGNSAGRPVGYSEQSDGIRNSVRVGRLRIPHHRVEKAERVGGGRKSKVWNRSGQLKNPDARVALEQAKDAKKSSLHIHLAVWQGIVTIWGTTHSCSVYLEVRPESSANRGGWLQTFQSSDRRTTLRLLVDPSYDSFGTDGKGYAT